MKDFKITPALQKRLDKLDQIWQAWNKEKDPKKKERLRKQGLKLHGLR
jgi:hypothetical protein